MANAGAGVARGGTTPGKKDQPMDRRGDEDNGGEEAGRKAPRETYDWPSLALFVIFLAAFVYALLRR